MYLYFHRAFDLVPHDSLAKILILHNISKVPVKWIKDWSAKRAQRHHLWEVSLNECPGDLARADIKFNTIQQIHP